MESAEPSFGPTGCSRRSEPSPHDCVPNGEDRWLDCYSCPQIAASARPLELAGSSAVHGAGCAEFFHRDAIAAVVVFDVRHVGLDQRQPPAAAPLQILLGRAIGHRVRVESRGPRPSLASRTDRGLALHSTSTFFFASSRLPCRIALISDSTSAISTANKSRSAQPNSFELREHFAHARLMCPVFDWAGSCGRSNSKNVPTCGRFSAERRSQG